MAKGGDGSSYEECVEVVREGLEDNTAYATAVRLQAQYGHNADKLIAAAAAGAKAEEEAKAPQPIELPTAEQIEADMLHNMLTITGKRNLTDNEKAIVKCFVLLHVEHRNWLLGLIGYEVS